MIEVRPSPVHGLGVFARASIHKGQRIGRYLSRKTSSNDIYVLWVEDEETGRTEGFDGFGRLRYLNHSRQPNSQFDGLELYATRTIKPGEEITFHYGDDWAHID